MIQVKHYIALSLGFVLSSQSFAQSTSVTCKAPRHYKYTLPAVNYLSCINDGYVKPFDVRIPDEGRAIAILNGQVFNYQASGAAYAIHSWSGSMVVGSPLSGSGSGQSVCAQQYGDIKLYGVGNITKNSNRIYPQISQYVSDGCTWGSLALMPGMTLDVWVEDSQPECQGVDLQYSSYFQNIWNQYGSGTEKLAYVGTSLTPMLNLSVPAKKGNNFSIYTQVEQNHNSTGNICGGQYESGGAYVAISGAASGATNYPNVIPPSGGMSHSLFYPITSVNTVADGAMNIALSAYVNQTKNANGNSYAGWISGGDSMILAIQNRTKDLVINAPQVSLLSNSKNSVSVAAGQSVPLSWTSSEATSMNATYEVDASVPGCGIVGGTQYTFSPIVNNLSGSYTWGPLSASCYAGRKIKIHATANNYGFSKTSTLMIDVGPEAAPQISVNSNGLSSVSLKANLTKVPITWSSTNAASVSATFSFDKASPSCGVYSANTAYAFNQISTLSGTLQYGLSRPRSIDTLLSWK